MGSEQKKILMELAEKLKKETDKNKILGSFVSAGIMNKKGEFIGYYSKLNDYYTQKKEDEPQITFNEGKELDIEAYELLRETQHKNVKKKSKIKGML